MTGIAYVNGSFLPYAEAQVSIFDRGFLFADGSYEVCAVLDGKIIDSEIHLARLQRSTREIELELPETPECIAALMKEAISRNALVEGSVYLQVTRGVAPERNFAYPEGIQASLIIFTTAKKLIDTREARTGIAAKTVRDIRWLRRDIKSISLLAQVLVRQEAAKAGCQEAIMVDDDGYITEGASSSVFILNTEGVLVTRPNFSAILQGCTRKAVVQLAAERDIRIEERLFSVAEALEAKEVFVTSAGVLVQSVVTIDGNAIGDGRVGPVARRLREIYIDVSRARAS
ncbi:D-amino-acid transaminase [Burkholderia sp. Bp8963]|uniref:D-amino-acid transaminase n=1 Tax=Burkholderia sp. Bp8963 TaxID=2184547 RepID=UPI000F5B4F83|nr:D-amino-acid transaminase [Burkholderia sp. Bp8963]RQS66519.1 D-amino-acid transaminase [Burkholderia sp. Bp8963]